MDLDQELKYAFQKETNMGFSSLFNNILLPMSQHDSIEQIILNYKK